MLVRDMASACLNNISENFIDISPLKRPSYGWLSPMISVSRDLDFRDEPSKQVSSAKASSESQAKSSNADPDLEDFVDFEFRLDDPVTMLPADELFSDGKLVPLHLTSVRQSVTSSDKDLADVRPLETDAKPRLVREICSTDPYLFSPKASTCSIRWKELLGLKKLYQKQNDDQKKASPPSSSSRSIKHLLHRSSKSSLNSSSSSSSQATDSCLNLPLLDNESVSVASRFSLSSSSSSGHEHDDFPRLSLDSDHKQPCSVIRRNTNLTKVRLSRHKKSFSSFENPATLSNRVGRSPMRREHVPEPTTRGISVDSPRMNASGKIVFHSLERSSSSPSTFNGGPRYKCRGMERSYSANVRITPVLNVPVCSLRGSSKFGFPLFSSSSQQKRENNHCHIGGKRSHEQNKSMRNRVDRT